MTDEESIRIDDEKIGKVNRIMASLGFHLYKSHDSSIGPGQFTDMTMYVHGDTQESVFILDFAFGFADPLGDRRAWF